MAYVYTYAPSYVDIRQSADGRTRIRFPYVDMNEPADSETWRARMGQPITLLMRSGMISGDLEGFTIGTLGYISELIIRTPPPDWTPEDVTT